MSSFEPLPFTFESKPAGQFPETFPKTPEERTAVVNAGDYRLYVGGGAINFTIACAMAEKMQKRLKDDRYLDGFDELHWQLLARSQATGGEACFAAEAKDWGVLYGGYYDAKDWMDWLGLKFAAGQAGEEDVVGSVFLSVLDEDNRPCHRNNVAMLYVVGPKGENCCGPRGGSMFGKARFLLEVQQMAKRAIELVMQYNSMQSQASARVQVVRWCLVSGGVYCHPDATKQEVARATLLGMKEVFLSRDEPGFRVDFTWDEDAFRLAFEELLSELGPKSG